MTPADMAQLHGAAFADARGWTAAEFAALLSAAHVAAFTHPGGFALTRTLAGESELLTLAVDPAMRRRGCATALMRAWLSGVQGVAQTAFLEVAADNDAARALYARFGFDTIATRRGYYTRADLPAVDALILSKRLTKGQIAADAGAVAAPKPKSG